MVINRGADEEIDVFPGFPLENKMSGNVVDLCPVGALGDRDFLYDQRVWFMKTHEHTCGNCSTGCSIYVDENQDKVYRVRPRENPFVNQWWMCDEGRYGFHHIHNDARAIDARRRVEGEYVNVEWSALREELDEKVRNSGRPAAVLSPHLTVEEAYLLAKYIRSIDETAPVVLGPVPVVGTDEKFPSGFTIHAEKAPNRRGVEQVVKHFSEKPTTLDDLLIMIGDREVQSVWVSGGYHAPNWIDTEKAARFEPLDLLIVQDMFASPLWEQADYQLPGAAYAEREGSFVNFEDRLQFVNWAIRPPAGVRVEGRLYWELLAGEGMFSARRVLSDIAAEIPFFSAAAGEIPPVGIDLKVNLLADDSEAGVGATEGGAGHA